MNKKKIYLITNADDFGLNNSVTDAIVESFTDGILQSTTLIVNTNGFDYAINQSKIHEKLGVGIHFNLTEGKPISNIDKVDLLVDEQGNFKSNLIQRNNLKLGTKRKYEQVTCELENQLIKMLDSGVKPSHFDSHHHVTGLPIVFKSSMNIAKKYGVLKARSTNINFKFSNNATAVDRINFLPNIILSVPKSVVHYSNKARLRHNGIQTPDIKIIPSRVKPSISDPVDHFISVLSVLRSGVTEISFHPGYKGSNPTDSEKTAKLRVIDLKILTSEKVKEYIDKNNIILINFNNEILK